MFVCIKHLGRTGRACEPRRVCGAFLPPGLCLKPLQSTISLSGRPSSCLLGSVCLQGSTGHDRLFRKPWKPSRNIKKGASSLREHMIHGSCSLLPLVCFSSSTKGTKSTISKKLERFVLVINLGQSKFSDPRKSTWKNSNFASDCYCEKGDSLLICSFKWHFLTRFTGKETTFICSFLSQIFIKHLLVSCRP